MDVNSTSVLSTEEWAELCAQLKEFPSEARPLVAECSPQLEELLARADTDCPSMPDPESSLFNGTGTVESQQKALCQTLTTMVHMH